MKPQSLSKWIFSLAIAIAMTSPLQIQKARAQEADSAEEIFFSDTLTAESDRSAAESFDEAADDGDNGAQSEDAEIDSPLRTRTSSKSQNRENEDDDQPFSHRRSFSQSDNDGDDEDDGLSGETSRRRHEAKRDESMGKRADAEAELDAELEAAENDAARHATAKSERTQLDGVDNDVDNGIDDGIDTDVDNVDGEAEAALDDDEENAQSSRSSQSLKSSKTTPIVPEEDEYGDDDLSLYPANHPKRRQQVAADDDDDRDGWSTGGKRHLRSQGQGDDDGDDSDRDDGDDTSQSDGRTLDERDDDEPWFAESFFSKRHIGLTAEFGLGGYFRQGSADGLDGKFAMGLSVAWNMGNLFFDRNFFLNKGLWLELAWLAPLNAVSDKGTDMLQVTQSQHDLTLAAIVGYPLWRLLVYGKFGPAMYVGSLDYDVNGSKASWSMVRGGVVYGVGVHSMFFVCDAVSISARVELLGHRRAYYNDLQFTLKLGAGF